MLGRRGFLGRLAAVIPGLAIADEFALAREKLSDKPKVYRPEDFMLSDNSPLAINGSGIWLSGQVPRRSGGCSG